MAKTPHHLLPIRERVAIEIFALYRDGTGFAEGLARARESWTRTTPATQADWLRRADTLIESLTAVGVTFVHDVEAIRYGR